MGFQVSELHGAPKMLIGTGAGITFLAIILSLGGFDFTLRAGILSQVKIVNGSSVWAQWKDIPLPVYLRVRIWNLTNPEETSTGAKPKLVEMGPYVYREKIHKEDITINEVNDTVRYHQIRDYFFEPSMSNGLDTDVVTFVNIPYVSVAKMAHEFTDVDFILGALDGKLSEKGEKFWRTEIVKELLFDGFKIQPYIDLINDPMVQSAGEVHLPPALADGRMGIFKGKNGSNDGWYEVYSGRTNYTNFGRLKAHQDKETVSVWRGAPCNMINGTDGILYQPFINPNSTVIAVFAAAACRSITFQPEADLSYHDGIPSIRYRQPEKIYQSVKNNPDNWCFCTPNTTCESNGFIDLGPCMFGAPIFLSQPHFLFADSEFLEKVEGLNPDPEIHWGYVDLHPVAGVSLEARHRMQFNVKVTRHESMPTFEEVQSLYMPLMWIEEGATLEGPNKLSLKALTAIMNGWSIGRIVLGAFGALVLPGLAIAIVMKRRGKNNVTRLNSAPSSAASTNKGKE